MPLVKSKSNRARQENIKREIEAGKPPAQAVAIGYSVQRRARKGKSRGRAGDPRPLQAEGSGAAGGSGVVISSSGSPRRSRRMQARGAG